MTGPAAANPAAGFWSGKRVVVTGHTGFKGAWLSIWLKRLGAHVIGISLPPATVPNLFSAANVSDCLESNYCDIREAERLARIVRAARPEIVLHLAAQALVRASYRDPLATIATNVLGTANVLESVRGLEGLKVVVAITTDKVYRNEERDYAYRETDALGGHDPYSASKAAAEIVIASYRDSFLAAEGVAVASARAGNVIGGGDWSADRLIPDAIRAWVAGVPLEIRRPSATRPWQHVLEPLCGYLKLAEALWGDPGLAGAYNFGPEVHDAASVRAVIEIARATFGGAAVNWGDGSEGPHEAGWLALEIAKAREVLRVQPRWPLSVAVRRSFEWYQRQLAGGSAYELCAADIDAYEAESA